MSESVSLTSALDKQLNKFDSEVDIEMRKLPRGTAKDINSYKLDDVSVSISHHGSDAPSTVKEGESDIVKRKRKRIEDKGSRL